MVDKFFMKNTNSYVLMYKICALKVYDDNEPFLKGIYGR